MCGIYCVVRKRVNREMAVRCINTMEHRGPDGWGVWQEEDVTLGHRRLSILDLTDNGHQPMSYANERYWLTFNGEIYNFIEIKKILRQKGYVFSTETDSEVILASFLEWREHCVDHFNGMWAFCIWDRVKKELFISRDRFGVKPLFYTEFADGGMAFASEMKALLPMMEEIIPNRELFDYYNRYQHYENKEECLVKGIKRFPAGSYAWFKEGKLHITKWWNTLDHLMDVPENYEEQVEQFRELFLDACKLRMRSDVTIGTALSGGLDSSATLCGMCWLAQNAEDERMNRNCHHAYIASFPGTIVDETKYAQMVTDYLKIDNTYINMNAAVPVSEFMKQIYLFEELWGNQQTPIMEVYSKEREDGTRVSIDGHGADELFAGYGFDLIRAYPDARFKKTDIDNITKTYLLLKETRGIVEEKEYARTRNRLYFEHITKFFLKKFLGMETVKSTYSSHPNWKKLDNLNRVLFVSTHETVLPTMLRNYDRNSMASGVEIRMPFLDYRIVQFAFSIGWRSKIRNESSKAIIRDAIAPFAPREIAYRKSKIGFNAPLGDWMRGIYKEFYLDIINSADFANCELVDNPEHVRKSLHAIVNRESFGNFGTISEAQAVWNQIQPYLWERAFLKHQWG